MKKTFSLLYFTVLMLALITLMTSCALYEKFTDKTECTHRDKNDDQICDRCGEGYDDGEEPKNRTVTDTYGFVYLIPANDSGSAYVTEYRGKDKDVVIPATCEGLPVTKITGSPFKNQSITSVFIPASIRSIPDAFSECYDLKSITVDDENEFFVSIDGNLYSNGGRNLITYAAGKEDTAFNIPDGVTRISMSAFHGAKHLKEITIPYGVENIYEKTFNGLNIEKINIPGSVREISESAFEDCVNLVIVNIENGVSLIDYCAFKNCSSLESIVIPNSVREFRDYVFEGCTSLKSAVVGSGISNEPYGMFDGCTALESVTINEGSYAVFPYAFRGCTSLTSVYLPETLKIIDSCAFYGCISLAEINIPERVIEIGGEAFYECFSLTSITIPKNVGYIGRKAFEWCVNLKEVIFVSPDNWSTGVTLSPDVIGNAELAAKYLSEYSCDKTWHRLH